MPIDTWIAGEPGEISTLATALETTVPGAIGDHEDTLMGPRNAYKSVWQGPAGEQVADAASGMIDDADRLSSAFVTVGGAVSTFGTTLASVQDTMAYCRASATANDLTVTGYLIEDVPPLTPMTYSSEGPIPDSVTNAINAHQDKVDAFNKIADEADDAISTYVDACQNLTDAIGKVVDEDWLAALVQQGAPGTLTYLGDDVLGPLAERLGRSNAISGALQGLDGDAMGDMMRHLFASVNGLSDRAIVSRLADLSEKSGGALDKYLLVAGILSGLDAGESLEQAIISEGGGFAAGAGTTAATTTILTWGAAAATGGSTVGPVGTVVIGALGLAAGTGVAIFTSNEIDNWYDDKEFEQLIRDGLEDQKAPR